MTSYPSESELLAAIDRGDELVRLCASGDMSFKDFCTKYDSFYWLWALDGHEADLAGLATLAMFSGRIAPHRYVAESILAMVCSDEDAEKEIYCAAGRVGSAEAIARLKRVAAGLSGSR